jgi:S1-C subfamily serine protease
MTCLRSILTLATALGVAGCASIPDVAQESRNIQVEENAVPTAAGAGSQAIGDLVRATGPTYLTLTVSQAEGQPSTGKRDGRRDVPITSGSGFTVDPSGYVMTAAHVAVNKGNAVSARAANGRVYGGTVVDVLPANDMALIKLRGFAGKAVAPASSQCLSRGSMVFSLGKPHEQGDTARVGSLEAMHFGRPVIYGKFGYPDAMVLQMGTQKGESGGPLFNRSGELVGMVVSTLTDDGGNLLNLAHAVPATSLAGFLCTHIACAGNWARLSQSSTMSCPQI